MEELIASYLIQQKECGLPLLGNFKINAIPALYDVAGKQIFPSFDEIFFSETAGYLPENLIDYISYIKSVSRDETETNLHNWCLSAKVRLDAGQQICFDSIGSLQKSERGALEFQSDTGVSFYQAIAVEKVIHKDDEHAVLVGDRETTSGAMNEFYRGDVITYKKSSWKMWALILFIIALLVLCFYFYDHDFSENNIGDQSSIPVASPSNTYSVPK